MERGTDAARSYACGGAPPGQQHDAVTETPTGINGLDEVTDGGLPRGRPTLVCGPTGFGKTLLGLEFLVRGIRAKFGETGVS